MKLNLGCGKETLDGWVNLDLVELPGVDIVFDLQKCRDSRIPINDDTVTHLFMSHLLEHIHDTLALMEELHRISKNGAIMEIRVPHGSHNNTWEDPTHVKAYFEGSWQYYGQPVYSFADYGYRGDWHTDKIVLVANAANFPGRKQVLESVTFNRNLIHEMVAYMTAIKPIREQGIACEGPAIEVQLTG